MFMLRRRPRPNITDTCVPDWTHFGSFIFAGNCRMVGVGKRRDEIGETRTDMAGRAGRGGGMAPCVERADEAGADQEMREEEEKGPFDERQRIPARERSEEHTSELQSLMRISYAVFCLKKKK